SSVKKYKQSQRNRMIGWTAVAAACLLIVGFNLSHWLNLSDESIDYASIITQTIPNSPDADITLFHSDNKEISMSGKEAEVDYDGGYVHFKTESSAEEKKEEVENKLNQLVVPKGKRSFVTLTDGTRMWVNAGTVVVFPTEFDGTKREIYVEGEVYLEVARDENKPFIVKSRQLHVEVLGTKFDVSAYNEDEFHHVTLVEGSVQVAMPAGRKLPLTPNQQLFYKNETKMSVRMVDNMHHLAWINGYYEYKDQTMDAVLKGLGKYYGKEITFDRLVTRLVCSGKLDLRNDIREVLAILQDAASIGVDYYEDKIYVYVKS
ncbi:FecR domain-containing protein, partial [Parabacteroides sp. OttesenSCG-928-N08]|nr:FecR domain-containing protein [Parabacteroides sp. OttesenSCG-928-N08]